MNIFKNNLIEFIKCVITESKESRFIPVGGKGIVLSDRNLEEEIRMISKLVHEWGLIPQPRASDNYDVYISKYPSFESIPIEIARRIDYIASASILSVELDSAMGYSEIELDIDEIFDKLDEYSLSKYDQRARDLYSMGINFSSQKDSNSEPKYVFDDVSQEDIEKIINTPIGRKARFERDQRNLAKSKKVSGPRLFNPEVD